MTDVTSFQDQKKIDGSISLTGMLTQIGINVALSVATLVAFSYLRPKHSLVYARSVKHSDENKTPPRLGQGLLDWLGVVRISEEEMIEKIGFDAVVYIRFLWLCLRIFLALTALGICVLIPINVVATMRTNGGEVPEGAIKLMSISAIRGDIRWFWAHVIMTWVFSGIILWFLYSMYRKHVELRRKYFLSEEYQASIHSRSLWALNAIQMQSDEQLADYFARIGHPVQQAYMCRQVNDLPEKVEKHNLAVRKLEGALTKYLKGENEVAEKRPTHKVGGFLFCGGKKVDSIEYYTNEIQRLEREIKLEREEVLFNMPLSHGFVKYPTISQTHGVARVLEGKPLPEKIKVLLAPQPKDIIWENAVLPPAIRHTRKWLGVLFFVIFCFIWIIPLTMVSAVASINNIVKFFPFTKSFFESQKFLTGLIEAYMAPLVMAIFFMLLPVLLRFLSKKQGALTYTSLERHTLAKLFTFFILNNLVYYTLLTTLLSIFGQIRDAIGSGQFNLETIRSIVDRLNVLDSVASGLVSVSTFWINTISLRGFSIVIELAQVVALLLITLKKRLLRLTPRELQELTQPLQFDYALNGNILLFFLTIGLIYSVIAPLVLPFTLVFFSLSYMVSRYQIIYVCRTKIETGGTIWRVLFNRIVFSLILYQIIMIGVMNIKGANYLSIILIPLPIITLGFKFLCRRWFDPKCRYYEGSPEEGNATSARPDLQDEQLSRKYGHPAVWQELFTPMVHADTKHLLGKVFKGHIASSEKPQLQHSTQNATVIKGLDENGADLRIQAVTKEEIETWKDDYDDDKGWQMSRPVQIQEGYPAHLNNQYNSDQMATEPPRVPPHATHQILPNQANINTSAYGSQPADYAAHRQ
ncbi:uncharacterized protein VTP21DRAFT_7185 [Calcarisporiella thermophila]|uniref:uncharacterized protein n=1 Tax=Calcarisporiella thermophila TaxID=911321 RepID=UPI003744321C